MRKLFVLTMLVLFVLIGGAGCSIYHSETKVEREFSGEAIQKKDIDVVITAADEVKMPAETVNSLTEKVKEKIENEWMITKDTDLVIQINITKYQLTSAFKRWLVGALGGESTALIIEGKATFLNKGKIILVVDVVARNSYGCCTSWANIEGVQEKFAEEVKTLLRQIKK